MRQKRFYPRRGAQYDIFPYYDIGNLVRVSDPWSEELDTTRPFRYDLNQIPYDYTVKVRNRFKGLYLIDTMAEELWMEVRGTVQEAGIKTIPRKKNAKKQNGCLRRPYK